MEGEARLLWSGILGCDVETKGEVGFNMCNKCAKLGSIYPLHTINLTDPISDSEDKFATLEPGVWDLTVSS